MTQAPREVVPESTRADEENPVVKAASIAESEAQRARDEAAAKAKTSSKGKSKE